MKGRCSRCKKRLTSENASVSVVSSGYGRCRACENEHAKKRSRTLGGKYNLGSAQARFNGHKWDLSFQEYAAIVALDECFYCGSPLPQAAGGLDREENGDYTWDAVLPCCGKQPRAAGPRGCNEIKSGEIAPIVLFARRWYEKYGRLPTEEDFVEKLQKFKTERDRVYKIICGLNSEELKRLRKGASVRMFLASLGPKQ
jgi:hypothetical protein